MSTTRSVLERWRRGRAIGLRVAVLASSAVLATGLVLRLSAPLFTASPTAQELLAGADEQVRLESTRQEPLFDDTVLSPGHPVSACTDVILTTPYQASPVGLLLGGNGLDSELARQAEMTVEVGRADPAVACDDLVADQTLAEGTLFSLAQDHTTDGSPLQASAERSGTEGTRYRVTVRLPESAPDRLAGTRAEHFDLLWTVSVPTGPDRTIAQILLELLVGVIEHSVLPLVFLTSLAILFTGIQNRIDRRDPKLAVAPVAGGRVEFS